MDANVHGCVLGVLIAPGVDESDLHRLVSGFHELGAKVHFLGIGGRVITTQTGVWEVDAQVEEVSPGYYDALIVPGPFAAARHDVVDALLQSFAELRRPIGGIGEGVLVIIRAGLAEGVHIAARGAVREAAEHAAAVPVDDLTVDGLLITTPGSEALEEFCERFAAEVAGRLREYVDEVLMETFPGSDSVSGAMI